MHRKQLVTGLLALTLCLAAGAFGATGTLGTFGTSGVGFAAEVVTQSLVTVGQGFVVLDADISVISLSLENSAKEAGQAYAENLQIGERIVQALQAAQLPGLRVTVRQPNLWPKTSLLSKELTYTASSGLDIQISDTSLVGKVADIGLNNGAVAIQGVRFDSSALEKAKQQAMQAAVQDAITKAQVMSTAAGVRLIMVRELRDTNDIQVTNPSVLQSTTGETLKLPALAAPIYRGQIIVTATVTIVFDVSLDKAVDVLSVK